MGRSRSAGYDGQRTLIVARAAALFARRGYSGTSMKEVAEAAGLSKATLYHYCDDKYALLVDIAEGHVARLETLVAGVLARGLAPEAQMRALITSLVGEYAEAQDAHRVLTAEVRFLTPADRERVLGRERAVVDGFAEGVRALRPDLTGHPALDKPLTMLLFGMVNWLFTWMKPGGELDHAAIAPIVADLFIGGLPSVRQPTA